MAARVIKIEIPIETQDKTDPALGKISAKMKDLDAAAKKAQKSMDGAAKGASGFEKSLGKSMDNASKKAKGFEKSLGSLTRQNWRILLEAKDKITPTVKQAIIYVKSLTSKAWRVTLKAVDLVTSPVRRVFGLLKSPLVAAGVTISAGAGIAGTVKTYADFEAAMSQVKAVSGATGEEFIQLTAKAKQMGATTKFTAAQSAEAFNYMAMAGWKASDMMSGIGGIMNLASASGEDLGTTSDIVTDALTAFGLKAADSTHFADVLAQASANANTNVSKMGQTFQYVAPVAGAMGYTIEDTALAIGLMANAGIKGEKAGTTLRSIFARLSDPPADAAAAIEQLGLSITNTEGSMRPLNDVMQDLRKSFAGLTQEQKVQMASQLAGQEAMSGLLALVNASEEDYNKLAEAIGNADGAAKRMSDTMLDNLSGKWTLFKSALDSVKISLGERMEPYLMEALDWLTEKMPAVEDALLRGMNKIDSFVDRTKKKVAEFTATDDWQNADLFGKIGIAWDELIAEPFSEWWSGSGKIMVADVSRELGKGLGMGISAGLNGILALFGIEADSAVNEGAVIGRQFAQGFSEGMKGTNVLASVGKIFSGMLGSAGKFLPGGESPDIRSFVSAVALAKAAGPLMNFGGGVFNLGKGIYNSTKDGLLKKAIGSFSMADELAGFGAATGSGLKGFLGKTGIYLGSAATSSAGQMLVGGGAIAGGAIGGAALISGINDFRVGLSETDDTEKSRAYGESGALKIGGVAAGAIAGASIGSVIPVVGTAAGALIGAGIGGLTGWLGGNRVKEDYEAQVLAAEKTKYAIEGAKFESKELKEAFEDTEVSAEEFASMMQEATSAKIKESFGDIKLFMQEIGEAAKKIVFGENIKAFDQFATAAAQAENSFQNLQGSVATMNKLNWKASLGSLDEGEAEQYRMAADSLTQNAIQYLEDKHYEAKMAVDLLVEPGKGASIHTGMNSMYAEMKSQVENAGTELQKVMDVALADGVISTEDVVTVNIGGVEYQMDEQSAVTKLQDKITEITNMVSQAETEAGFQSILAKYSGADLSAESFGNLMSELQVQAEEGARLAMEALETSLTNQNIRLENAKLKFEAGEITVDEFGNIEESVQQEINDLTEGYQVKISEIGLSVERFAIEGIANSALGEELENILPEFEGALADRLQQAYHNALENGVDATQWSGSGKGLESAIEWLGLEDLTAEAQSAVAELMGDMARTMPEDMSNYLADGFKDINVEKVTEEVGKDAAAGMIKGIASDENAAAMAEELIKLQETTLEGADYSGPAKAMCTGFSAELSGMDMSEAGAGMQEGFQSMLTAMVEGMDLTVVAAGLTVKLGDAMASIDMSESGTGLQEGIQSSLTTAFEGIDLSGVAEGLNAKLSESFAAVENVDMSGFMAALQTGLGSSVEGMDYGSVTAVVGTGVGSAITDSMSTIQGAIDSLYSSVGAAINSAFSAGFQTSTTVTITVDYQLANPSATISFSGGGSGTATVSGSIASNANGGYSNGPELTLWGEDGPEVIIPLGSKRRSRGLELWQQAGEILSVHKNADGGIIRGTGFSSMPKIDGGIFGNPNGQDRMQYMDESENESRTEADAGGTDHVTSVPEQSAPNKTEIHLNMEVNPQFTVSGNDGTDVIRTIREHIGELADDMSGAIYQKLKTVFENMPVSSI